MSVEESVLLTLNRFLPSANPPGRESLDAYSRAQLAWAESEFEHFRPFISIEDKVVLDAGCGRGGKTIFYSRLGPKEIVGFDRNPTWIEHARRFAAEEGVTNVRYLLGSLHEMPFDDDTFDVIFMNDVLEHVVQPLVEPVLREIRRVVKPGGNICLNFPPWSSYDAAHLYDRINVPWCQLFFSDEALLNVYRQLDPENADFVRDLYLELNRLTIDDFEQLVDKLEFEVRHFELATIKNIRMFSSIRMINKYLTRRVVAILGKPRTVNNPTG